MISDSWRALSIRLGARALLERAETDRRFYQTLAAHCRRLAPLVDPRRELAAWRALLAELSAGRRG